jgi:hypothetical protein
MTAVTITTEETLQICARELRAMTEHGTHDNGTRETLTRGYFRLLRRLRERAVSFYTTGGR